MVQKHSVSLVEAAKLLNISLRTVYNRIKEGKLQTIRTHGGSQRVLVESLHGPRRTPQSLTTTRRASSTVEVEAQTTDIYIDDGFVPVPAQPVEGKSARLLRATPGTDAVPRACPIDGAPMDRREADFVCVCCGHRVNVYI